MLNIPPRAAYPASLLALAALVLAAMMLPARIAATVVQLAWAATVVALAARAVLRWRTARATPEHVVVASIDRRSHIAGNYASLHAYLDHRFASTVVLTFEQIESLLGFALPQPASTEADWWTTDVPHDDGHTEAWTRAGRSATPNLSARTIAFERCP